MSSTESATPSPPDMASEHAIVDQEALDQLDRDLIVAERIRDYSDEIYMYTRQQWIDWKHRVDRERAQAAAERSQHRQRHHHHPLHHAPPPHAAPMGTTVANAHGPSVPVPMPPHKHETVDSIPIGIARSTGSRGAVNSRQEPFNFYGPSSPASELTGAPSDNSD
ncbi:hypothetical protein DL93DRAFT_2073826 [Clavulina sp. PMI_390]|nr:hypothetical protein DL93DRAFT_2073826 [Clavulina sp. PMI_390]